MGGGGGGGQGNPTGLSSPSGGKINQPGCVAPRRRRYSGWGIGYHGTGCPRGATCPWLACTPGATCPGGQDKLGHRKRGLLIDFFSYLLLEKNEIFKRIFTMNVVWWPTSNVSQSFSIRRVSNVCKHLTSLLESRVSCLSPKRQHFPGPS